MEKNHSNYEWHIPKLIGSSMVSFSPWLIWPPWTSVGHEVPYLNGMVQQKTAQNQWIARMWPKKWRMRHTNIKYQCDIKRIELSSFETWMSKKQITVPFKTKDFPKRKGTFVVNPKSQILYIYISINNIKISSPGSTTLSSPQKKMTLDLISLPEQNYQRYWHPPVN